MTTLDSSKTNVAAFICMELYLTPSWVLAGVSTHRNNQFVLYPTEKGYLYVVGLSLRLLRRKNVIERLWPKDLQSPCCSVDGVNWSRFIRIHSWPLCCQSLWRAEKVLLAPYLLSHSREMSSRKPAYQTVMWFIFARGWLLPPLLTWHGKCHVLPLIKLLLNFCRSTWRPQVN